MIETMPSPKNSASSAVKKFSASEADFSNAQRNFDFLMPYKKALLTTLEVGKVIHFKDDYVRELIQEGRLEAHGDPIEFKGRPTYRVTRRSVLVYFMRTAQYDASHFVDTFEGIFPTLTKAQLQQFIQLATRELVNRPL